MALSSDVLAANEKLEKQRKKLGKDGSSQPSSRSHAKANHVLKNGQKLLDAYRQRDGVKTQESTPSSQPLRPRKTPLHTQPSYGRQARLPLDGDVIKHYPSLGVAALNATDGPIYRVWLLCRHLDKSGRGWLEVKQVRDALTKKKAKLKICGWRRLRQILTEGEGLYWERNNGRLWLYGVTAVCRAYELVRLNGRPVSLPVTAVVSKIGEFQAHLYGAWHSGRRTENPISRAKQRELLHIPERTQRHYCRVAQIQRIVNYAIGGQYTPETQREGAWEHGNATFPFKDKRGYQGKKNQEYIAWQLPSSHKARHSTAPKGRLKKINRQLTVDLVNSEAQGNNGKRIDKLFFKNGAEAAKAYSKQGRGLDAYWPQPHRNKSKQCTIWFRLF